MYFAFSISSSTTLPLFDSKHASYNHFQHSNQALALKNKTSMNNNSNNNSNVEEKPFCRLCHGTDDDAEQLAGIDLDWVHPCKCSGSIKWVHRGCFMAWRAQASSQQRKRCSICSHVYRFSLRLKPRWYAELPISILLWPMALLHLRFMHWLLSCIATFDFLSILRYPIMYILFVMMSLPLGMYGRFRLTAMLHMTALLCLFCYVALDFLGTFRYACMLYWLLGGIYILALESGLYNDGLLATESDQSLFEESIRIRNAE